MNKKSFKIIGLVSLVASTVLLVACQSDTKNESSTKSKDVQWGYTGATGPDHSPINITGAEDVNLPELNLNNQESEAQVENNGHTIEVSFKNPKNTLTIGDDVYKLQQFHFHAPSENEIDGQTYPLEGHFVYKTDNGKITVVSVLYNYGDENQTLKQIWDKMPQAANTETELPQAISLDDFYPEDKDYYNFEGSLTTPPCTEGVNWIVFKNQETVSKEQVEKFTQTLGFENNRPIQDTNGRKIKE